MRPSGCFHTYDATTRTARIMTHRHKSEKFHWRKSQTPGRALAAGVRVARPSPPRPALARSVLRALRRCQHWVRLCCMQASTSRRGETKTVARTSDASALIHGQSCWKIESFSIRKEGRSNFSQVNPLKSFGAAGAMWLICQISGELAIFFFRTL